MKIYLITGDCDFTAELEIKAIIQDSAKEVIEDSVSENEAIATISTPSLFEGNKVFIFKGSKALENLSQLFIYHLIKIKYPVIFVVPKYDKRTVLGKWLYKNAQIKECNQISQWDTQSQYLQAVYFSKLISCEINPPALREIVQRVGNNSRRMYTEIAKLKVSATPNAVNVELVKSLVNNEVGNAIDLTNACRKQDILAANSILEIMGATNVNPAPIIATLLTYFKAWVITKEGVATHLKDIQITKSLSLNNPNRIYYLKREVETCSLWMLRQQYLTLLESSINHYPSQKTLVNTIIKLCKK